MPHPIVSIPNQLGERLRDSKGNTVLYCDYYYFALIIEGYVEFWLNGNHFMDKISIPNISKSVINYLDANCPKFVNFYKNGEYNPASSVIWKKDSVYHQNIPKIGNAYSAMIYKIVTEKDYSTNTRVIHLHEDWGTGGWAEFETIGEKEVEAFLTLTIFSETYKTVKSVYDLDCFKH